jgi:hypothetical protein
MSCVKVSLKTDCMVNPPDGNTSNCFLCQNTLYENQILNGDLANSTFENGRYQDTVFGYWNETSKTVYLTIGLVGLLTCSYYIR